MQKKIVSTITILMLLGSIGFANVTNPFSKAMLEADKVVQVKVTKAGDDRVVVSLVKTYRGKPIGKDLKLRMSSKLEGATAGDICFLLLDKNNSIYKSNFGCGEHSVIIIRHGKVHKGIFKYHRNEKTKASDYTRNDDQYNSITQIDEAVMAGLKPKEKAEILLPQNKQGNFVLHVSNQSFAESPVDITIYINGKKALSSSFPVGNQHFWKKHCFTLPPGKHKLIAVSKKGKAKIEKDFEIKDKKHWAAVDYWYYPKKDGKRFFTFVIQNLPIQFE